MNKRAFSLIELSIVVLIIGVLIAGATQATRLISEAKLKTAQTLTESSAVKSISGITLWLETSMADSITSVENGLNPSDEDLVSSWNDYNPHSITKINLTQSGTSYQPRYEADGINGIPSIKFDGSNDALYTTNAPIPIGDDSYTLIAVFKHLNSIGSDVIILQKPLTSADNQHATISIDNGGELRFGAFANSADGLGTPSLNTSYISIMSINNNDADGSVTSYFNSNTAIQKDSTDPDILDIQNGYFSAGAAIVNPSSYNSALNGLISEVIIFDRAINQEEAEAVNSYLSQKYGIALN